MLCNIWVNFLHHQHCSGFTLLEVVVSLTLLGFILVIIFGAFRLGLSAWDKGESIKEEYQKVRIVSQMMTRQIKSIVPYRVKTQQAEGHYLTFEGKPQSLRFVSTLPVKSHRLGGLVYTTYRYQEDDLKGGRLLLYEKRALNRDLLAEEPKEEEGIPLMEGIAKILFEYYQEEDSTKNQSEAWLEEWDGKEKKVLPKGLRVTVVFKDQKREVPPLVLLIPIAAFQMDEVRLSPVIRRTLPGRSP